MADIEAPSFSLCESVADFEAPSFSLGIELDAGDLPSSARRDPEATPQTLIASSLTYEAKEFEPELIISSPDSPKQFRSNEAEVFYPKRPNSSLDLVKELQSSEPEPAVHVLNRLRRGPSQSASKVKCKLSRDNEDDIEDISSEEDYPNADDYPSTQNHFACSSSRLSLHGRGVLTSQLTNDRRSEKPSVASDASLLSSFDGNSNKKAFPRITISPIRKFQLLDSDSDDPSSSKDVPTSVKKVASAQVKVSHSVLEIHEQKGGKNLKIPQSQSLWKDFSAKESVKLKTPALDEFCKEYFSTVNARNPVQCQREDSNSSTSKLFVSDSCLIDGFDHIQENAAHKIVHRHDNVGDPLPPAYGYFYHDDQRIRDLVRRRLPYFCPLGAANFGGNCRSDEVLIDYMSQFGQRGGQNQPRSTLNEGNEGSSKKKRKTQSKGKAKRAPQTSDGWVNPKSEVNPPKDAGKRRVSADGVSSGHWYTGEDGRKVYVTKNGQELTGQTAYRHYRKESGMGYKRKKKPVAKKKMR
ncbi:uncharacterized protein LOC18448064 isoform X1 [Amborella trichopoda]|nr:uncharacterized protein LOC18448064 isoform X1 [Amborella trichopoda]XP_020531591.1 uncharacterized protein LOC18448064 isoform X1 [Amborella trichopoda]|eukprot:XP_020531590.1 uncharacterized protein LOC18448064 isoform X1 [Amborella trichopoda]